MKHVLATGTLLVSVGLLLGAVAPAPAATPLLVPLQPPPALELKFAPPPAPKPRSVLDLQTRIEVTRHYNRLAKAGRAKIAKRCLNFRKDFEHMSARSGIPVSVLAGVALQESGCKTGGRGMMQVFVSSARQRARATQWTGHSYVAGRAQDEIALGTSALWGFEQSFGNRVHGLLAYNIGPGRLQGVLRRTGKSTSWAKLASHLPAGHRDYLPSVIASSLLVADAMAGKTSRPVSGTLEEIPGFMVGE